MHAPIKERQWQTHVAPILLAHPSHPMGGRPTRLRTWHSGAVDAVARLAALSGRWARRACPPPPPRSLPSVFQSPGRCIRRPPGCCSGWSYAAPPVLLSFRQKVDSPGL